MLQKYLEEKQNEMIEKLRDLVAIESISDDTAKTKEALDYVLKLAESLGMKSRSLLDGQVGEIEIGSGQETVGILTHVDVVPPGDLSDWTKDPYSLVVENGRLYGRGTLDDKGMVIASVYAMKAVMESGVVLNKTVRHIIGTQEETSWNDMNAYVKNYPLPDYGFTPDGEYPLCNIEKGIMDVRIEFAYEKNDKDKREHIIEINAGETANVVPGRAKVLLSSGREISAEGKAVHSCQPEKGKNATFLLAEKIKEAGVAENGLFKLLMAVSEGFSDIYGSGLGIEKGDEYYKGEFIHTNVFSPTIFQAKDGKAVLNINVRFPWGETKEHLLPAFEEFAKPLGGKIASVDFHPAVFVSKDRPFMKTFAKAYEDVSGLKNEFTLAYGGSYAKAIPNVVSWGPIFPGEGDTCHEPDEYISLEGFMKNAKIFAQAIYDIAVSEQSFK